MLQLLFISAFIIYGYTYGIVYTRHGVLKSISDSVHYVKPWWLFALAMISFPFPFMIVAQSVATNWAGHFSAFLGGGLICLVGVANCYYKGNKSEEKIHGIGAVGGIIFGLFFLVSISTYYLFIIIPFIFFVLYCHFVAMYDWYKLVALSSTDLNKFEKWLTTLPRVYNHTWVIEVIAITIIHISLLFELTIFNYV